MSRLACTTTPVVRSYLSFCCTSSSRPSVSDHRPDPARSSIVLAEVPRSCTIQRFEAAGWGRPTDRPRSSAAVAATSGSSARVRLLNQPGAWGCQYHVTKPAQQHRGQQVVSRESPNHARQQHRSHCSQSIRNMEVVSRLAPDECGDEPGTRAAGA
jgi:hypothetical protein